MRTFTTEHNTTFMCRKEDNGWILTVLFEPLHVAICFQVQLVHPVNEWSLLVCIMHGKDAKSVLIYKVIAKGELKKQVVRFLLFLWIKAEQEGFPCLSSSTYANEVNGIPMTCSWVKVSIAWRRSIYKSALMLGDFSLPVRTEKLMPASAHCLSHMGVFIRCSHQKGNFIPGNNVA